MLFAPSPLSLSLALRSRTRRSCLRCLLLDPGPTLPRDPFLLCSPIRRYTCPWPPKNYWPPFAASLVAVARYAAFLATIARQAAGTASAAVIRILAPMDARRTASKLRSPTSPRFRLANVYITLTPIVPRRCLRVLRCLLSASSFFAFSFLFRKRSRCKRTCCRQCRPLRVKPRAAFQRRGHRTPA